MPASSRSASRPMSVSAATRFSRWRCFSACIRCLAIVLAGVLGALIAIPVAPLLFRLQGAYFAIGTWVLAEVFRLGFAQVSALGGGSGSSLPAGIVTGIASSRGLREMMVYWTGLALALGALAFVILAAALARWPGADRVARQRDSVRKPRHRHLAHQIPRLRCRRRLHLDDRRVHLPAEAPHFARRRLQRQRLDSLCHLHRGHRRHWHDRRSHHRHHPVLRRCARRCPTSARPIC